jgi:hypothetical protein
MTSFPMTSRAGWYNAPLGNWRSLLCAGCPMRRRKRQRPAKCPKCGTRPKETKVADQILRRQFAGIGAHGIFARVKMTYEVTCKCGTQAVVRYRDEYFPDARRT